MKIELLAEKRFDAVRWHDNCSEMKRFCHDCCTITYETCCVDDYWKLVVNDYFQHNKVAVALGDYVVKLSEKCFFVVREDDFDEFFKVIPVSQVKAEKENHIENKIDEITSDWTTA